MNETLKVFDNVLPDIHSVREWATRLSFSTNAYQGEDFPNTASDWGRFPVNLLSDVMGFRCENILSVMRLGLASDNAAAKPFIHSDDTMEGAQWAAVIYLTNTTIDRDNYSATAFWRHKETGLSSFPEDPKDLLRIGYDKDVFSRLHTDGFDEKKWHLEGLVRAISNRMIIYPTSLFHSRYPATAYGDSPETGRLIWCSFFRAAA